MKFDRRQAELGRMWNSRGREVEGKVEGVRHGEGDRKGKGRGRERDRKLKSTCWIRKNRVLATSTKV